MTGDDEVRRLRDEVTRLEEAVATERGHADQWRQVAEERRVQLEKLRQHPVIALLFRVSRVLLPPLRRTARRTGRWTRSVRRTAAGVKGLRHQLDAPRRQRRLDRQLAALDDPPASPRRVSIVIPTRDGRANLARLLPALAERTLHDQVETIVVDNASGPDTARWLDARDDVRVLRNDANRSFSDANNQGAAAATGDTLLFLNDDVEPASRGWLRRLLRELDQNGAGEVVAVGAQLVYPRRPLLRARTRDLGVQHLGTELRPVPGSVPDAVNLGHGTDPVVEVGRREVAAATAACLLVDRVAFDAAGGFDPRYHYGAEDVDLCWTLRRRGGQVVVATDAVLYHHEGATRHREDSAELHRRQAANWDRLAAKYGPELARAVTRDRLTGRQLLTSARWRVAITITRDLPDAGYGDYYTAHELGGALAALGWEVSYVERYRDAWYDLDDDLDALIVLLDVFDLRRVARPGLTTIAWVRNWTERWTSHPWFDDYDVVLASSATAADLVAAASRHRPAVFPLATNPQRFRPGPGPGADRPSGPLAAGRSGAVFTGNYWGRDERLGDLVAAVPDLVVYGKGWDEVAGVGAAWRGALPYDELPQVYAGSLVVVDQAADHTRAYGSVNSRVFDALAAGALPVTNQRAGAHELFGDALPVYRDAAELADVTGRLLADPDATVERATRLRERVLAEHTYAVRAAALRDLLLARLDRPSFALAISAPDRATAPTWGDWHFAEALARELKVRGHEVVLLTADTWDGRAGRARDVFAHLKGRGRAPRADGQLHVIWNISHPEELTPEECDAADLVLVASHTGWDRELAQRTSTPVGVLLQATDERRFRRRPAEARYRHEVAFVGNSRFVLRAGVADALQAGLRPAIYGANWDRFVDPGLIVAKHIPNEDLPRLYSSVTVLLNDHWDGMRRHGFASNRLFDALACGAVVVSDHVDGLDALFDGGVVTYRRPDELRLVVDGLLADEAERRARGERGRAAVLAAHTFAHRADQLLDVVAGAWEERSGA